MRHAIFAAALLVSLSSAAAAQTIDRDFKLVAGALVISSIFDAETTVQGIKSGRAHEANPLARPFVGSGNRGGTYAFALATDAAVLGLAYHLKRKGVKRWWLLPVAGTAAHVIAGGANLRFVF